MFIIKFLVVLFIVFIKQVVLLIACNLSTYFFEDGIIIPIIILPIYSFLYYSYSYEIYNKLKIKKTLYDIYEFISWILVENLIIFLISSDSWLLNFLPKFDRITNLFYIISILIILTSYLIISTLSKFFNKIMS